MCGDSTSCEGSKDKKKHLGWMSECWGSVEASVVVRGYLVAPL